MYEYKTYTLTSPLSSCVNWKDAQTGSKIIEQLRREPLGHDVSELSRGRHMENSNLTKRYLFSDKMNIELDMLSAPMLNRVRGHVDGADIVTKDDCSGRERMMKFAK